MAASSKTSLASGEPPSKTWWWKRKRWWAAAAVLWLVIAYPLGLGPVRYASTRDWISRDTKRLLFEPVNALPDRLLIIPGPLNPFWHYLDWWQCAAYEHMGYEYTHDGIGQFGYRKPGQ